MSIVNQQEFIKWESASRDTIDLKRAYIDVCEDLAGGVFISQLLFYFLPVLDDQTGKYRRHYKLEEMEDGELWMPMNDNEWWQAARIKRKQVINLKSDIGVEVDRNGVHKAKAGSLQLVLYRNTFYKNKKTPMWRPNWAVFLSKLNPVLDNYEYGNSVKQQPGDDFPEDSPPSNFGGQNHLPKMGQSVYPPENEATIVRKTANRLSQKMQIDSSDLGKPIRPDLANHKDKEVVKEVIKKTSSSDIAVADEISNEISSPASVAIAPTGKEQSAALIVERQLLEFAAGRNITISADEAAALVATWPAAQLADGQLFQALSADYELFGLDHSVDDIVAQRKLIEVPPERLRWFMCVWCAFEESTNAYHERTGHRWNKTKCFMNKVGASQPPASWLEKLLSDYRIEKSKIENEAIDAECRRYWDGLTALQKRELEIEVGDEFARLFQGEKFTPSNPDWPVMRLRLLRKPEVREMLADVQRIHDENAPKRDLDAALATAPVESAEEQEQRWEPETVVDPVQLRLELYVAPILRDINAGVLELADIDTRRPSLYEDEEWQEIVDEVGRQLAA